jgi:hypothetical protein
MPSPRRHHEVWPSDRDQRPRGPPAAFYQYCNGGDVPELEPLARTIARWEVAILRWHRTRLTNTATEGTNLVIKNIKRLGFGFRKFDNNYRLRLLLRGGVPWQTRRGCINTAPPTALQRLEAN